jgi:hypothetical protein
MALGYTMDSVLGSAEIINAVVARVLASDKVQDRIIWKDYLNPKTTNPDGTFKTFYGTKTGVIVGSLMDRYSNKPIRKQYPLQKGYGEVATLGETYQFDNARLEELQNLINYYNLHNLPENAELIVEFLQDDIRQAFLAPHKRMDLMLSDLKFTGTAATRSNVDEYGVKINKIKLPISIATPEASQQDTFITYFGQLVEEYRNNGIDVAIAEMSRATFSQYIANCEEFKNRFAIRFGSYEMQSGGLITPAQANELLEALQIPITIRLVSEYITTQDKKTTSNIPTKKIALLPDEKLGSLRWKYPYEWTDRIPNKTYCEQDNGQYIATQRTEEGRFIEYGCEWIVEIDKPNRMAIVDLSNFS